MVMHVHAHLISVGSLATKRRKLIARKCLARLTDVEEKVAQEAIRLYNAGESLIEKVVGQPTHH